MKLDGPPLWDFYRVMELLQSVRPNEAYERSRTGYMPEGEFSPNTLGRTLDMDVPEERGRVYGMYARLPEVAAHLSATRSLLLAPSNRRAQEEWQATRDRLARGVADCQWPDPRLASDGYPLRMAIEYVNELEPARLRTICDEGPTPEEDWQDALDELLSAAVHVRRVLAKENEPTVDLHREEAKRIAARRREDLRRWRSY